VRHPHAHPDLRLRLSPLLSSASCSSSSGSGSGGSAGTGTSCANSLQSLGFTSACNACITKSCIPDFQACEADDDCSCELKCVAKCYLSSGNLESCATTCVDTTDAGHMEATKIVDCVLNSCGSADECMVAAK
jgi:hypothetical protein